MMQLTATTSVHQRRLIRIVFLLASLGSLTSRTILTRADTVSVTSLFIKVLLPIDRTRPGTLSVVDQNGHVVAGPFPVLGRSTGREIVVDGNGQQKAIDVNPTHDPLQRLGDTPTGTYRIQGFIRTGDAAHPAKSFGKNFLIKMVPESGEALHAANRDPSSPGNPGIFIHAGRPTVDGSLKPTHGCLRVQEETILALYDAIMIQGTAPISCEVTAGQVTVGDLWGKSSDKGDSSEPESPPTPDASPVTTMPGPLQWGSIRLPEGDYKGDLSNGKPHGSGTMAYPNRAIYKGEFRDGKRTRGRIDWADDSYFEGLFLNGFPAYGTWVNNAGTYVGNIANGTREGPGVQTYPNNAEFAGTFHNGLPTKGSVTWKDGSSFQGDFGPDGPSNGKWTRKDSVYTGEIADGTENGRGETRWNDGRSFSGEFTNGEPKRGLWSLPDGTRFDGTTADGKPSDGTYTWPNGNSFSGTFVSGHPSQGKFTWHNGNTFEGTIVDGAPKQGKLVRRDYTYDGEFQDGLPHGQGTVVFPGNHSFSGTVDHLHFVKGTYTFPDGDKYVGSFQNDRFSGQGTYFFHDGRAFSGTFSQGHPNKGVTRNQSGQQLTSQGMQANQGPPPDDNHFYVTPMNNQGVVGPTQSGKPIQNWAQPQPQK